MALEAAHVAESGERATDDKNRRARSERRGRERRGSGTRVNRAAPADSLMKGLGAMAAGLSSALFAIVLVMGLVVLDTPPWAALAVTGVAVIVSVFALLLGSIEQRLIEIRLELMMANGGRRQVDRRTLERRGDVAGGDYARQTFVPRPANPDGAADAGANAGAGKARTKAA